MFSGFSANCNKMAGRDQYDVSPRNREILEFRASRRNALRQEFLKETLNPYRHASSMGGSVFDEQLQRLFSLDAKRSEYMRATTKSFLRYCTLFVLPMVTCIWLVKRSRDAKENDIRTGKISYRDRTVKFV